MAFTALDVIMMGPTISAAEARMPASVKDVVPPTTIQEMVDLLGKAFEQAVNLKTLMTHLGYPAPAHAPPLQLASIMPQIRMVQYRYLERLYQVFAVSQKVQGYWTASAPVQTIYKMIMFHEHLAHGLLSNAEEFRQRTALAALSIELVVDLGRYPILRHELNHGGFNEQVEAPVQEQASGASNEPERKPKHGKASTASFRRTASVKASAAMLRLQDKAAKIKRKTSEALQKAHVLSELSAGWYERIEGGAKGDLVRLSVT